MAIHHILKALIDAKKLSPDVVETMSMVQQRRLVESLVKGSSESVEFTNDYIDSGDFTETLGEHITTDYIEPLSELANTDYSILSDIAEGIGSILSGLVSILESI